MTVHPVAEFADLAAKAKSPQQGLFPGNDHRVGSWLTPASMMRWLQALFGRFMTDACPYPCPAGFDGIKVPWNGLTHVNPPFEGKRHGFMAWVRKAIAEKHLGNPSVLTFPMDEWVHAAIEHGAVFKSAGAHNWIDPRTGKERRAGRKTMLIHFPAGVVICPPIPDVKEAGCKLCLGVAAA